VHVHTYYESVSTLVSWASMRLMREPHTGAFNIGFCLHGMYVRHQTVCTANVAGSAVSHVITATTCSVSFMCLPLKTYLGNFWWEMGDLPCFYNFSIVSKVAGESEIENPSLFSTKFSTCFCFYTSLEGLKII